MTNILKLIAALATIAMLAPVAGAEAASNKTLRPTHHNAITRPDAHNATHHARRSIAKFQRDGRAWN